MSECEVCCGSGRYPVITRSGEELYSIPCPECVGLGTVLTDDEIRGAEQRRKYDAAMRQMPSEPAP